MRIFRLNPSECEFKYCFASGAFPYSIALREGAKVLPEMKEDGVELLEYRLDEDRGGLEIGDYFTTTTGHLPVTRRLADALQDKFTLGDSEFVPARIKNAKNRIHVPDAAIANPLGRVDCLDWERSELNSDKERPLVTIFGRWSLKRDRIPPDRDLFRVKGLIGYLFSERLVDYIREKKLNNLPFEDAPLT